MRKWTVEHETRAKKIADSAELFPIVWPHVFEFDFSAVALALLSEVR